MSPEESSDLIEDLCRQPMAESAIRSMLAVLGEYWSGPIKDNSGNRIGSMMYNPCDKNYVEVMGMTIVEGYDLQKKGDVLVNEELVSLMRWTDGTVD